MARHPHPDEKPLRVVVAGGGVGGLEALVALRSLAGHRVALTLVAPQDDFTVRALEVLEPFGLGHPQRYPLAALAADLDATFLRDAVARVERDDRVVHLQSGDELVYDRLVLAVGAFPYPAYEHGVCFTHAHDAEALDDVVSDLRAGLAGRIAIVVPPGCAWTLPAYELALMVAAFATPDELTLVTPEHEPLSAFGARAADWMRDTLQAAGIELLAGVEAGVPHPTVVQLSAGARLTCDRVVHLPLHSGPNSRVSRATRTASSSSTTSSAPATTMTCSPSATPRPAGTSKAAWPHNRRTSSPSTSPGRWGRSIPRAHTVPSCEDSCGQPGAPATCALSRPGEPRRRRSPTSACGGPPARWRRAG